MAREHCGYDFGTAIKCKWAQLASCFRKRLAPRPLDVRTASFAESIIVQSKCWPPMTGTRIDYKCVCGKMLRVPAAFAGLMSECPHCARKMIVPHGSQLPAISAPPALEKRSAQVAMFCGI